MSGQDVTSTVAQSTSGRQLMWRRMLVAAAILVVVIQWIRSTTRPNDGDFFLHWEFGRRLLVGEELYFGGLDVPYPPFWAVAFAPLSLLPLSVAKAVAYPIGVGALAMLFVLLARLARERWPISVEQQFWVVAVCLALSSRFVVRELTECGPNMALVAASWLAVFAWMRGRDLCAGTLLGVAMALKCTPGVFLAYFAWKRQWKPVFAGLTVATACTLAPALWQGWSSYAWHMRLWSACVRQGAALNPAYGPLGEEYVQNISLRPALARFLMRLPEGHRGRVNHPLYADFLDLSPQTAGLIVKAVMLLLAALVAWSFRRRVDGRDDPALLWEFAAISVASLLYSPITWGQHCVGLIPVLYLIVRSGWSRGQVDRWTKFVLGSYVALILVLNRGLVGRDFSVLLDSYHVHTLSILGILALALAGRVRELRMADAAAAPPLEVEPLPAQPIAPRHAA